MAFTRSGVRVPYPPRRIISGGQTGADRAGLDAAIELGIPHGGFCPRGRRAEDGRIPDRYALRETSTAEYPERTEWNVEEADGTVVFTRGRPRGGSALTLALAARHGRPALHVDLAGLPSGEAAERVRSWIVSEGIAVLNVAGSREGESPGIHDAVREILHSALQSRPPAAAAGRGPKPHDD